MKQRSGRPMQGGYPQPLNSLRPLQTGLPAGVGAFSLGSERPSPPANDRCARVEISRPLGTPESSPNGKRWSVFSIVAGNSLVFFDNP